MLLISRSFWSIASCPLSLASAVISPSTGLSPHPPNQESSFCSLYYIIVCVGA